MVSALLFFLCLLVSADGTPDPLFYADVSWSPDGSRLLFSAFQGPNANLYVMNADGTKVRRLTRGPGVNAWGALSPDGRQIVFQSSRTGTDDIYVMNVDGRNVRRLTRDAGRNIAPSWSPDGKRIAFSSDRGGSLRIHSMRADGSERTESTRGGATTVKHYNPVWSPDGRMLAYYTDSGDRKDQIVVVDAGGSNPLVVTGNAGHNVYPHWSPDAKRILFVSDRDGIAGGIFAIRPDGTGLERIGNATGCSVARWSPDGKKIAFVAGDYPASEVFVMNADGSGVVQLTK
jgi:TolB protein